MKEKVAMKIANQEPDALPQPELDSILLTHPLFGCYLIKAMKKKEGALTETTAALQVVVDRQEKELADYSQGIKLSEKEIMVTKHEAELEKHKKELSKCKVDLDKHKAELNDCKEELKKYKATETKDGLQWNGRRRAQQIQPSRGRQKVAPPARRAKFQYKVRGARVKPTESESGSGSGSGSGPGSDSDSDSDTE